MPQEICRCPQFQILQKGPSPGKDSDSRICRELEHRGRLYSLSLLWDLILNVLNELMGIRQTCNSRNYEGKCINVWIACTAFSAPSMMTWPVSLSTSRFDLTGESKFNYRRDSKLSKWPSPLASLEKAKP